MLWVVLSVKCIHLAAGRPIRGCFTANFGRQVAATACCRSPSSASPRPCPAAPAGSSAGISCDVLLRTAPRRLLLLRVCTFGVLLRRLLSTSEGVDLLGVIWAFGLLLGPFRAGAVSTKTLPQTPAGLTACNRCAAQGPGSNSRLGPVRRSSSPAVALRLGAHPQTSVVPVAVTAPALLLPLS